MRVIQEHEKCIGCGSCVAICPKYWGIGDDEKAKLVGARTLANGNYQLEVEEIACNQEACDVCPVQCIRIEK